MTGLVLKSQVGNCKKSFSSTGNFTSRRAEKYFQEEIDGKTGFALGFISRFRFIFGRILIAYLIRDENWRSRIKWAWIGFRTANILVMILFFTGAFDWGF